MKPPEKSVSKKTSETVQKRSLPMTLAQRLQTLREALDLSPRRLAEKASIPQSMVEDIESGLERFLSPAIRQRLARALRVKSSVLQEVELVPEEFSPSIFKKPPSLEATGLLLESIQQTPHQRFFCPSCGSLLIVRVFSRRDLEEHAITALKIHCSQCLFQLSQD